jgi:flagellar protein FlaJ
MGLTRSQRVAYRLLGPAARRQAQNNAHLRITLQKAHILLRPEVYLGYAYFNIALVLGVAFAAALAVVALSVTGILVVPGTVLVLLVPLPVLLAGTIYLLTFVLPDLRAGNRARDIDAKIPYALNYIATMASAGVTPDRVFASLAAQPIYGEVANEAAWISRDIRVLGKDVVGALTAGIDRSPSAKWQDLLQGAISAVTSGGDLKTYFLSKSEQFMYENRQAQRNFLESLGLIAESFVTVVVAAPLFLIVLLSVMGMFRASGTGALTLGYVLVLLLLPMAQVSFIVAIRFITPEV